MHKRRRTDDGGHSGNGHIGQHDKYCVWCRWVIKGQNLQKIGVCTNQQCKRPIPLRVNSKGETIKWSQTSGWGHCPNCDSFTHAAYFFCSNCGDKNLEAVKTKAKAVAAAIQKELLDQKQALVDKDKAFQAIERELMAVKAELAEKSKFDSDLCPLTLIEDEQKLIAEDEIEDGKEGVDSAGDNADTKDVE